MTFSWSSWPLCPKHIIGVMIMMMMMVMMTMMMIMMMIPSVMGGSRSRQPRQLRRPFSSKGTFQGGMMTMIMMMTMVSMMIMIMTMTMVRMRMISSLCFQLYVWQHSPGYVFVLLAQNSWHLFHYWPFDRPPQTPPSPCQSGHVTSPNQILFILPWKIFTPENIHPE